MSQIPSSESKIQSPELKRLAREHSSEVASVIIELDLPARMVEVARVLRQGSEISLPRRVAPASQAEGSEVDRKTEEAKVFLQKVLGTSPRWLKTARSFVAEVTGPQLEKIATSPLTKAIHPNRSLR